MPADTSVTRREFLVAAGASSLFGAAGAIGADTKLRRGRVERPVSQTGAGTPGVRAIRTLRAAVMYGMIGEGETTLDRFKVLRDAGFEGVEMDSPTKIPMEEIAEASAKTGVVVHGLVDSVHWAAPLNHPADSVRTKALDGLRTCLRDAKTLGCESVLLVPAVVNKDLPYLDAWERSIAAIGSVMPLARECGVKIGIENVWNGFIQSPLEAARYVDELNLGASSNGDTSAARAAWHFDIGNIINFGWPEQWIRTLGARICKLHIKDFSRGKRDKEGLWKGFDVELGEGDADWPAVMRALDDIGYSSAKPGRWATAEVRGGNRKRLEQVREQMARLLAM